MTSNERRCDRREQIAAQRPSTRTPFSTAFSARVQHGAARDVDRRRAGARLRGRDRQRSRARAQVEHVAHGRPSSSDRSIRASIQVSLGGRNTPGSLINRI